MRRSLDMLFATSAVLACLFFASIGVMVILQVVTRMAGMHIAGLLDYATFAMVAAAFFGLAPTLKRNQHIRVTLLLHSVHGTPRRLLEMASYAIGFALMAYFSWYSVALAYDSWRFGLKDMGLAATPLWIPQSGMAMGSVIAAIAFLEGLIISIRHLIRPQEGEGTTPEREPAFHKDTKIGET
ncbi:TRAP transporter small permease subunit [Sedimentitalea sp.]|uniref:TRAP transporter small permease n=1 Tax=Sedimentitalea sp. TaxID=2048915 RepID=UPI0032988187